MSSGLAPLATLFIPSPSTGVWYLGPFPLRAYALCIILGIVVAVVLCTRRWIAVGGRPDTVETVVILAVPFGIIGARLYHVITDYEIYFGPGSPKQPIDALKIWDGGLGVWGAVALGALGGWIVARRRGVRFPSFLDACAPGVVLAQAIGRVGNYFNQELFGRPTTLPWGLEIDPDHRPLGYAQYATFHPTFLYELVWNVGVCIVLLLLDRKYPLGRGKLFALYVMLYTAGRFWIEALRIDTVNEIGGFRLNNYTSVIVFVAATGVFLWLLRNRPGRDEVVETSAVAAETDEDGEPPPEQPEGDEEPRPEPVDGQAVADDDTAEPHPEPHPTRPEPVEGPDEAEPHAAAEPSDDADPAAPRAST